MLEYTSTMSSPVAEGQKTYHGGLFESAAWCNSRINPGSVTLQGFVALNSETTGLHQKRKIVMLVRLEKKKLI